MAMVLKMPEKRSAHRASALPDAFYHNRFMMYPSSAKFDGPGK